MRACSIELCTAGTASERSGAALDHAGASSIMAAPVRQIINLRIVFLPGWKKSPYASVTLTPKAAKRRHERNNSLRGRSVPSGDQSMPSIRPATLAHDFLAGTG
jgi:hypothetical protein